MTLLITGLLRIQVIKQGRLCLLGYVPPGAPAPQPPSFSSAERERGSSCLCHQPTLTHHGSRTGKGVWGSVNSSDLELGFTLLQIMQGLPGALWHS